MVLQMHTDNPLVFYDPSYPQCCSEDTLTALIPGSFRCASARDLAAALDQECTLLISFHGAYFPKSAWRAILAFLERGGNLAIFGGMPFTRPVTDDGQIELEQDSYTRQIHLGPYFSLPLSPSQSLQLVADEEALLLRDCPLRITASGNFWSFNPQLTQASDHPDELGSAGPIDTVLQPLIYALDTSVSGTAQRVATPASILDQRSGRFKGGRWLLSPWQPASEEDWLRNVEVIQRLLALASQGATTFEIRPTLGCYQPGETPALLATARTTVELQARISLYAPNQDSPLSTFNLTFPATSFLQEQSLSLPTLQQPGLYRIVAEYLPVGGQALAQESGFWIWDEALVASTRHKRLTARRDYFYQEDQLFLVYGTTYMDSRVQRKFLHLPNPARWDRDFTEMQAAGINLIRTGIWTAWREFIPMAGVINEAALRALDAFVMTACKHNIQLVFTFFSFFPTLFEGENPWLDPRSVEAQQDYVACLARRYAQVELLSWDLINEPSFGDPHHIFAERPIPNYDRFEVVAFRQWLTQRYTLSELQLRWRKTPADLPDWEHVTPPGLEEYDTYIRGTTVRATFQVADYTRFSQDMFSHWASRMLDAIRAAGSRTLVGVGQDESSSRISPQFYASAVDYTTTHPWWNIDNMLWDMLLDKTLDKPNLIQETGIMQLRDIDGLPWRSQQGHADMLERKLITGLAARGAGLIQWLWHTNSYMTNENENSIGLVRADGSAKPELHTMVEFGRLVQALDGRLLEAPSSPDVWVVIPYAQWFTRPNLGRLATQQAVRVLGYDLGIIPQLVGEHQLWTLNTASQQPRAIIVPALQLLDPHAWEYLLTYVQAGGKLLVSGVITRDTHYLPIEPGLVHLPTDSQPVPVSHYEELEDVNGQTYQVIFGDEKMSYVRKAHNQVHTVTYGAGTFTWSGLPLELANDATATRVLYTRIIGGLSAPRVNSPVLIVQRPLREGTLLLAISEASKQQLIELAQNRKAALEPNRAGALILNNDGTARAFGGLRLSH